LANRLRNESGGIFVPPLYGSLGGVPIPPPDQFGAAETQVTTFVTRWTIIRRKQLITGKPFPLFGPRPIECGHAYSKKVGCSFLIEQIVIAFSCTHRKIRLSWRRLDIFFFDYVAVVACSSGRAVPIINHLFSLRMPHSGAFNENGSQSLRSENQPAVTLPMRGMRRSCLKRAKDLVQIS